MLGFGDALATRPLGAFEEPTATIVEEPVVVPTVVAEVPNPDRGWDEFFIQLARDQEALVRDDQELEQIIRFAIAARIDLIKRVLH